MHSFYGLAPTHVVYNKKQRDKIWNIAKKRKTIDLAEIRIACPALAHQIHKSYAEKTNIQSAVFSECVYAQALANMLDLCEFIIYDTGCTAPRIVEDIIAQHQIVPRYLYTDTKGETILIQAGGHGGTDCFLINVPTKTLFTIEFKEPGAKTSEVDLPKYGEDGMLVITDNFLQKYPQFKDMLREQQGLNFFTVMGNNVHNFTTQSIEKAVNDNYDSSLKAADVICTEDKNGYLTMIPSQEAAEWAHVEGEIRPAGRNHSAVWTPLALHAALAKCGAKVADPYITIAKTKLETANERGGNGSPSRYKINPLFFVYCKDCTENNSQISFSIESIQQLRPTIAGKMFFKDLLYGEVKKHYQLML